VTCATQTISSLTHPAETQVRVQAGMDTAEESIWTASVKRSDRIEVGEFCPRQPYVEIQVPTSVGLVRRVAITTLSHDQGTYDFVEIQLVSVGPADMTIQAFPASGNSLEAPTNTRTHGSRLL
jgi:hypothetical protein